MRLRGLYWPVLLRRGLQELGQTTSTICGNVSAKLPSASKNYEDEACHST